MADPQEFTAVREVLLTLSKDVEAEEATGFNPSGIGAEQPVEIDAANAGVGAEAARVAGSDVKSNSDLTIATNSSQSRSLASATSSKSSARDTPDLFRVDVFDDLSIEEKKAQLGQMFTSLKPIDIDLALKKLNGDASLAIDELLNLQWLEETGQRVKGIDGFYAPDGEATGKKKKGKKKKKAPSGSAPRTPTSPVAAKQNLFVDEEHNGKCFACWPSIDLQHLIDDFVS